MLTASFDPTIGFHTCNTLKHCSYPDQERTFSAFLVGVHGQLPDLRHALSQGRSASDAFQATEELYIAMLHMEPSAKLSKPFQPNDA